MKIKIEIDEGLPEDEVLIRCRGLTEQIADVQKAVSEVINTSQKFVFYRGNTEYYLTLDEILFFENGKIVERGTHEELMAQDGIYRRFISGRERAVGWKL